MGRGRNWSILDMDYLQDNWGIVSLFYISNRLKRTKRAIKEKALKMNLGASTQADEYLTANQVSILLNKSSHTIIKWIREHNLKAIRKVMFFKRKFWLIKHSDLLLWLKYNQSKYDSTKINVNKFGYIPEWLREKRIKDYKYFKRG